eukprot:GDKJ01048686.1.p1 GENE.GDKJ01048686.1~~GDKJ01048686.1.p1  ORF type:complete len:833 (-),score=285.95 GDKJ01048686.1:402-2900(-)
MSEGGDVRVVCRFRPQNEKEKNETGMGKTCMIFKDEKTVQIQGTGNATAAERTFTLDRVFPCETKQKEVFDFAARPVIDAVLQGYNGTVLAYGQTSSGKTFTMNGVMGDPEYMGVIPRMVRTIFEHVDQADEHIEFQVKVSIAEIYNERIIDLLNPAKDNLKVHEDKVRGIYVGDITEEYVACEEEVFQLMEVGQQNRSVAATNMNEHSSRSHLVFMITINQKNLHDLSNKTGKLYLVDLAGSEKVGKTGATGTVLDEAKGINKSLSALGNVINSLTDAKAQHVPYRDSKLTRVLQESLGGNSKTTLIVTASPSIYNETETVSTLRFGVRAKAVKNKAKVNQERSVEELKRLLAKAEAVIKSQQERIALLEKTISDMGGVVPEGGLAGFDVSDESVEKTIVAAPAGVADPEETSAIMEELEDKKTELRKQSEHIGELNKRIVALTERAQNLEQENNLLVGQVADLTVTAETVKYELQELQDAFVAAQTAQKGLETEMGVIKESHKAAVTSLQEKETEADDLAGKLEKALADLQRLQALRELDKQTANDAKGASDGLQAESPEHSKTSTAVNHALYALDKAVAAAAVNNGAVDATAVEGVRELCVSLSTRNEVLAKQVETLRKVAYGPNAGNAVAAFEEERKGYLESVEKAQGRVMQLEVAVQEERAKNHELRELHKDGERPLKKKVAQLDRHLEQVTIMYHKLVSQNSGLKVEVQVNEKKLKRKEERIESLEKALKESKAKYEKLLQQCASLTQTVENMSLTSSHTLAAVGALASAGVAGASSGFSTARRNISRPVRGGGGLASYFKRASVSGAAGEVPGVTPVVPIAADEE